MNRWFEANKTKANIFILYTREAHPADGRSPDWGGVVYNTPKTFEERRKIAFDCSTKGGVKLPFLIDRMDDACCRAYSSWPNRTYIIGGEGIVYFKGTAGPQGITRVKFESPFAKLISLPGGGRFTDKAPKVSILTAEVLKPESLKFPVGFKGENAEGGIGFRAVLKRKAGKSFTADAAELSKIGAEFIRNAGFPTNSKSRDCFREDSLSPVDGNGEVAKGRKSKFFRIRYSHWRGNVLFDGDYLELTFDAEGIVKAEGAWHKVVSSAKAEKTRSSLDAAKAEKQSNAIVRLVYKKSSGEDGKITFTPFFRFAKGKKTTDAACVVE